MVKRKDRWRTSLLVGVMIVTVGALTMTAFLCGMSSELWIAAAWAEEAKAPAADGTTTESTTAPAATEASATEVPVDHASITETSSTVEPATEAPTAGISDSELLTTEAPATESPITIEEPEEEPPVHAPKMIISAVTTDLEKITLGNDVTVTVDLKNTSTDRALYNMMITYDFSSEELLPLQDSNSTYVSFLRAGGTASVTFSLHVSKQLTNYHPKIHLTMEYEDEDAVSYTSSGSMNLTIHPFFGFHADDPIAPISVESGQIGTITVNLYNTGTAEIYNVYCDLQCRGFIASGKYYVGHIDPEQSVTATLTLIATDRQYGALGDKNVAKYGDVNGKVVITYEDEAGNPYRVDTAVHTEITAPPEEQEEVQPDTIEYSSQWWISVVVLLIFIDVVILVAVHYRQKHRV